MQKMIAIRIAVLVGVTAAHAYPQSQPDDVTKYIEAQMQWRQIPGLALGVVRSGRVIRAEGFGNVGGATPKSVTPTTIFHLGSVGKSFTAAALLILAQDGVISLDDPITKYLDNTPAAWRGITIQQLLTHTSGLQNYVQGIPDIAREYSESELLALIASQPLAFKPGTNYRYSNSGYVLAGLIVEKASERSLGDFLSDRIFKKLEMDSTAVTGEPTEARRLTPGYRLTGDSVLPTSYGSPSLNRTGDGSVFSTVLDLAKWDASLFGDSILNATSRRLMWTPVRLANGSTKSYGLGWSVNTAPRRQIVEHGGVWSGFSAHMVRYITDSVTVIVLFNVSGLGNASGQIANKIARYYIADLRAAAWPTIKPFRVDSATLASYAGVYKGSGGHVRVTHTGSELVISAGRRGTAMLIPVSQTEFVHPTDDLRFRFVTTRLGVRQLIYQEAGRAFTLTK